MAKFLRAVDKFSQQTGGRKLRKNITFQHKICEHFQRISKTRLKLKRKKNACFIQQDEKVIQLGRIIIIKNTEF